MKRILLTGLGLAILAFSACAQKKGEWQTLFDGTTLENFKNFKQDTLSSAWVIDGDALHLKEKKGGDIVTLKDYENFELELEWKISEGGNSGVFFHVSEDPKFNAPYRTGPEMQILDDDKHPDSKIIKHRASDNYDLITANKNKKLNPVGEYNKVKLVCNKGKVEHWLNGKKVVEYVLWTDEWKKMVAASKFVNMPDYGLMKTGKIGLQDHGDKVWFRNIRIREL